jgi:hypothetical protein
MGLMPGKGQIDVRVLDDGTVRAETGDMGGVTHQAADNFLKFLATLVGGEVETTKAKHGHAHAHAHDHEHDHERH